MLLLKQLYANHKQVLLSNICLLKEMVLVGLVGAVLQNALEKFNIKNIFKVKLGLHFLCFY